MIKVLKGIREAVYGTCMAVKISYHFGIQRNVGKALNDLIEYRKCAIKNYGSWTIWDIEYMHKLIDIYNRNGQYNFETRLLHQAYDLMEAEEIRKEFGV